MNGPQQKFCDGIVSGLTASEAYRAAYPGSAPANARKNATRLTTKDDVKAEIARLRAAAALMAGSAVLTLAEKRSFLARLVRAKVSLLEADSDLWSSVKKTKEGTEYRLPDKLAALIADNDLAGDGSESSANDAIAQMLERVRV